MSATAVRPETAPLSVPLLSPFRLRFRFPNAGYVCIECRGNKSSPDGKDSRTKESSFVEEDAEKRDRPLGYLLCIIHKLIEFGQLSETNSSIFTAIFASFEPFSRRRPLPDDHFHFFFMCITLFSEIRSERINLKGKENRKWKKRFSTGLFVIFLTFSK